MGSASRLDPGHSLAAEAMDSGYINREPGQYRFVFEVALDSQGHELLPYSATSSAPFEVQP
jgi:hypothetical protein